MRNKKEILKFMRTYTDNHKLEYCISTEQGMPPGMAFPPERYFVMSKKSLKWSDATVLSIFFHEAMHLRCYEEGIFPLYHCGWENVKNGKGKLRSQAWRAEKHVDRMAKEEMKNYFPDLKYKDAYLSKKNQWNREWILEWIGK